MAKIVCVLAQSSEHRRINEVVAGEAAREKEAKRARHAAKEKEIGSTHITEN